ncbi:hypothetical protein GGI21_005373, partial [Coemansia aciculifera]
IKRSGKALVQQVKDKCPTLADPTRAFYVPSPLMSNGHLQTIHLSTRHYKTAGCPVSYKREVFTFADGGKAAIDWSLPCEGVSPSDPLIVIISGIGGGSHNYFVRSFAHFIGEQQPAFGGYQVCVLHSRGCNGVNLVTPKSFHSGMTEDLREFVNYLTKVKPNKPTVGVGFSLGANILCKYMGEEGEKCPFIAAISVGNPFDIDATMNAMSKPSFKNRYLYAAKLTKKLVNGFDNNKDVIMSGSSHIDLDPAQIVGSRTLNEFNELYAAKAFGY